jgi:hypothetical protein
VLIEYGMLVTPVCNGESSRASHAATVVWLHANCYKPHSFPNKNYQNSVEERVSEEDVVFFFQWQMSTSFSPENLFSLPLPRKAIKQAP